MNQAALEVLWNLLKYSFMPSRACSASCLVRKIFPISHLPASKRSPSHLLLSTNPASFTYQYSDPIDGLHCSDSARSFIRARTMAFFTISNAFSRVILQSCSLIV